jgi:hypothetical protein
MSGRMELERHAFGADESYDLDDVRQTPRVRRVGLAAGGAFESVHAGGVVGVVRNGAGQAPSQAKKVVMMSLRFPVRW